MGKSLNRKTSDRADTTKSLVKFHPLVEEVGVLRYTRLAVGRGLGVYSIYSEYTKKFKGIAVNDGTGYRDGTLKDLETALNEG